MIPSTFTLLVAATSTALSANALPIFSGFFAAPAAPAPAALVRRDLTDGQLAQGTNAFFRSLLLEDACTPGQVACINNNTATCSPEANWEITPCPSSTTCLALPASSDSSAQSLVVKCTTDSVAVSAIQQAGGTQDLAVDYSITSAPFNATTVNTPDNGNNNNSTDIASTDVPTNTDSFTDVPTTPTDVPTGTDASIVPTGVCTDEPAEPTETEYITVIAFPDPSNTDSFTFSTIEPTDAATITLPDVSTPTETISQVAPVDTPTDSTTDTVTDTAALPTGTDAGIYPTDTANATATATATDVPAMTSPCVHPDPAGNSTDVPTDTNTDTNTDTAAAPTDVPTGTDSATTGAPTTLVVPPNFSIETPVPDINTIGTFEIPATTTTSVPVPIRRSGRMQRKVRRS